jgi:hypothetical protein
MGRVTVTLASPSLVTVVARAPAGARAGRTATVQVTCTGNRRPWLRRRRPAGPLPAAAGGGQPMVKLTVQWVHWQLQGRLEPASESHSGQAPGPIMMAAAQACRWNSTHWQIFQVVSTLAEFASLSDSEASGGLGGPSESG